MASIDLGALLKGLSGGMGRYADVQFAERLQREAEQRKIAAEQRALAQKSAERDYQLQLQMALAGITEGIDPKMQPLASGVKAVQEREDSRQADSDRLNMVTKIMQLPPNLQSVLLPYITGSGPEVEGAFGELQRTQESTFAEVESIIDSLPLGEAQKAAYRARNRQGDTSGVLKELSTYKEKKPDVINPDFVFVDVDADGDGIPEKMAFDKRRLRHGQVVGVPASSLGKGDDKPLDLSLLERDFIERGADADLMNLIKKRAVEKGMEKDWDQALMMASVQRRSPFQIAVEMGLVTPEELASVPISFSKGIAGQGQPTGQGAQPTSGSVDLSSALSEIMAANKALMEEAARRRAAGGGN